MYAFPKSARLRHNLEFRETLDQGVKSVSSQVVVFARPRRELAKGARIGLIVSRKVGESVARSRVKRHLREAFRLLKSELESETELKNMDLVVIARPSAANATSQEIAEALQHGLKRMHRQLLSAKQGPHDC